MAENEEDGFTAESFKGLEESVVQAKPTDDPITPPAVDPATPPVVIPKEEVKPVEEPKKNDEAETPPAPVEKKTEVEPQPGETPPVDEPKKEEPEASQPLTKDDVTSVITDLLQKERSSGKELETTAKEVLDAYYPDGLSDVLVDETTKKELRTPQDVVDASGGTMPIEEAAQWLMNEQHKLNNALDKIKNDARTIAETTVTFKRDATAALQKYEPLFKAYPQIQDKIYKKLMKQVKVDKDHGVILSAPDVMEYYDDYLEPYQQAFEQATHQPATNPIPAPNEPPKPTADDRLDESGDGGPAPVDDPNDFAQQVSKELAKGM